MVFKTDSHHGGAAAASYRRSTPSMVPIKHLWHDHVEATAILWDCENLEP